MRRLPGRVVHGALLALAFGTSPASAQRSVPVDLGGGAGAGASVARAVRAERAPVLDGRDDDEAWRRSPVMREFRQFAPAEGGEPSERTEARVTYDDRHLYVLVRAWDSRPDSIVSLLGRRDVSTSSDRVQLVIDGYHDRRTGVTLAVTPGGVKLDASIFNDGEEDLSWDGVWDAATGVDSLGWVAEFRIPFGQLRFTAAPRHTFGFGVWRDIARRNERVSWPLYRTSSQGIASQLGTLDGIAGIATPRRFELLPYALARSQSERRETGWGRGEAVSAGADVKYGITPNLTLDATVNPDFGQVEADPAVLNLTAFETRFEERRPFFQEGVGLFRCAGPCEGIFYTRRIGRTPQLRDDPRDPAATTILGAAKLTGRLANGLSLGLVEAVTDREVGQSGATVEPRTNYLVGRLYRELRRGRSGAGAMVTAVHRDLDPATAPLLRRSALTGLLQGFHRFAGDRYELMGYAAVNRVAGSRQAIALTQLNSVHLFQRPDHDERFDSARTSLAGNVQGLMLQKLSGVVRGYTYLRHATPGVELNDLGFVPLVDDFQVLQNVEAQSRRPRWFYRRAWLSADVERHWTTGGLPSALWAGVRGGTELRNSWSVELATNLENFAAAHCVACARGGPALRMSPRRGVELEVEGDPRRALVPSVELEWGTGDGGRSAQRQLEAELALRVASQFSASAGVRAERLTDDAQWVANAGDPLSDTTHFTFARLRQTTLAFTARASYAATPTLSLQLYAEPFVSAGSYSRWRELADPRHRDYDRRFRAYGGGAAPPGFNVKSFNSNVVARWEYRPGSTLFLVWQQGRSQEDMDAGSFAARRDYRNLFRAHPENTLLVKASYWVSL